MNYIETCDLKARLRKNEDVQPIRKALVGLSEPVSDRTLKFTISTSAKDRDNDTIMQDGWELAPYVKNPVVLLNHKSSELPIGKCILIGIEDGKLKATVQFVPSSYPIVGDTAEAVFSLCKDGYLNATSVGFRPIAWDWAGGDSDGIIFSKQELLEWSIVSVPSNPEAILEPTSWFASDEPKHVPALNNQLSLLRLRLRMLQLV